jgi:hypothetical protein
MDRKLSDEQLNRIAKNLLKDFALDNETLDEITESPTLWRNVRNNIEAEKERREKSWFFAFRPQILTFGALAIVICFGLAIMFLNSKTDSNLPIARQNSIDENAKASESLVISPSKEDTAKPAISKEFRATPKKVSMKNAVPKTRFIAGNQTAGLSTKQLNKSSEKEVSPKTTTEETKTDFIALSYAANADSGQIVRVKVPRSMMVSLGITTNVEKNSELVTAEVILGDDGAAQAIRFVQ